MASRGKCTQQNNMFTADFETCDMFPNNPTDDRQKVWLAGYKNLETMKSTYFYNLSDFMTDILARKDNINTEYAFHNLKFDGSYIVPWLLTNGYEVSQAKPQPKQFSILVDNRNSWYSITIQVTKKRKVLIWDLLKLFPMALEYIPQVYSTPTHKIIEDDDFYTKYRPDGYIPDERDITYFENDLQVPAEVINKHIEMYGLQFKKTQASQSFYNFTQGFPTWKWRFVPLDEDTDKDLRPAYWGGISHVQDGKQSLDHFDIGVYDINSSYPDKAANYKLPYGRPILQLGEGAHPDMSKFWVAEALVRFTLKPNCLPCIPTKAIIEGRPLTIDKWLPDSDGVVRMKFSCIDYGTILQSYDFKVIRWVWSIHFAWKIQKEVQAFVYENNDKKVKYKALSKVETDPEKKAEYSTISNRSKIDNNSFYGKFGEDIIKEGKTPYLDDVDGVTWKCDRLELQKESARKFLPVAIAITAWGRRQLVQMANILGEHFLYCDTDSIHYLMSGHYKIEQAIKDGLFIVDDTLLGAWKFEGHMVRGRYLRSKCYMELTDDGDLECTLAGLPADKHTGQFSKTRSYLTWDNFYIGLYIPPEHSNKLRSVRTPTGTKLEPTHFTIKENTLNLGGF